MIGGAEMVQRKCVNCAAPMSDPRQCSYCGSAFSRRDGIVPPLAATVDINTYSSIGTWACGNTNGYPRIMSMAMPWR